jgi:hypothetical protein
MIRNAFAVLLIFTSTYPCQLAGQERSNANTPRWTGHFTTASANVLLSALTAGITQELKGGSFRDGFTRGALGGLVIYGGKRIAVENFSGAGFIGREITAVGASMVRNAADSVGTLDRLVFPAGVTRVYWSRTAPRNWQVKLDVVAFGWTVYGIAERELEFDVSESLSSGTPVFVTSKRIVAHGEPQPLDGATGAGVIFVSVVPSTSEPMLPNSLRHERVHVLQSDQLFLTLNDPHDDAVLRRLPFGKVANRWVDVNVTTELIWLMSRLIDSHAQRPWEMEANYLSR